MFKRNNTIFFIFKNLTTYNPTTIDAMVDYSFIKKRRSSNYLAWSIFRPHVLEEITSFFFFIFKNSKTYNPRTVDDMADSSVIKKHRSSNYLAQPTFRPNV